MTLSGHAWKFIPDWDSDFLRLFTKTHWNMSLKNGISTNKSCFPRLYIQAGEQVTSCFSIINSSFLT
jgi:hypothetical protein